MSAPIAAWLRETRLRQHTADGAPWGQEYLLERMAAEIGWAPHRPNYSKYETGKSTPEPATVAKFVRFWELHGEPGPDLTPPAPEPDLASALLALTAELRAAREERMALVARVDAMDLALQRLSARAIEEASARPAPEATTGSVRP